MGGINPGHRYCLYARVSPKGSQWDAEETSIRVQLHECEQHVLRLDPAATFIRIFDEFKSGKNLSRPGVQQIIDEIDSPHPSFDTLVVWQLDRLSRNLADAAPLFAKLRDAGLGFISVRQSYLSATGAMARFNLNQTILIAQLEREMTAERITAKMHWIAQQGKITYGKPPLGYRRKAGVKNVVEVDPVAAEVVRDIFRTYLSGDDSMTELWARHRDHIRDSKQFYRILRNRFYIGEIVYKGTEVFPGEHEPIIDRETFDLVQTKLPKGDYNKPRPGRQKYAYLLSGLVHCHCGQGHFMRPSAVSKPSKRYFYYKCTDSACGCAINAERLDMAVLEAIQRIALDPEYVRGCYEEFEREVTSEKTAKQPDVDLALKELSAAKSALADIDRLFTSGVVTPKNAEYWNDKLVEARSRVELATSDYDGLMSKLREVGDIDKLKDVLKSVSGWASLLNRAGDDVNLKRALILATVARVRCVDPGKFELDLVIDPGGKAKKRGITDVMPKCGQWWRWDVFRRKACWPVFIR